MTVSEAGNLMRKALKRHWLPEVSRLGFVGKTSKFQRLEPDAQDLLSLQYSKYGGEFILEFARRPRGPFQTNWGKVVPEGELAVAYINPLERARLKQIGPTAGSHFKGFEYASLGDDLTKYEALARQVASLMPSVDAWLRHGTIGDHIFPLRGRG